MLSYGLRALGGARSPSCSSFRDRAFWSSYSFMCWSIQVMERDISAAVKAGAHGVVIGVGVSPSV